MRGSVRDISQIAAIFAYEKSGKTTKYTRAGASSGICCLRSGAQLHRLPYSQQTQLTAS